METYEIELKDMILHDETPYIDQADSITFAGSENYDIIYQEESSDTYYEEDVYFVNDDNGHLPLDSDTVESYLSSINSLGLGNYVSYNATEEELAVLGLDDPELTTTIQYMAQAEEEPKTFVIHVSRSAQDKQKAAEEESIPAYVRIGESQIIYEITETEYESLMAISYNELRHQEIFWADFDKVTKADLTLEGKTYTLTSGKEGDETVWFYGEEEIAIDDFQTALTALTAKRFKNEEVGAKEELSMTLYLNDENYPTVHIGMYRRDGDTCMAVVDGEPTALVTRSKVVDLMEAVNAIVLR